MLIFLDAGHGGKDPGCIGNNLREKDLTLQISLYQKKRFNNHGIQVQMTRENDSTIDLDKRMKNARKSGVKIGISNHINAGGGKGAEVWRSVKFNTGWGEKIIDEFKKLDFPIHGQGVKTKPSIKYPGSDYFAMNNTYPVESVIIEYGFIDSSDAQELVNRWKELAEAVVKATVEYLGIKYIPLDEEEIDLTMKPEDANKIISTFLSPLYNFVTEQKEKDEIHRLANELRKVSGQEIK